MPNIPHGPATTGDAVTTEIHQKTVESLNDRNRAALFGMCINVKPLKIFPPTIMSVLALVSLWAL